MDVFKLAFETTVVGLLTFVWLAVGLDLLFPNFFAKALSTLTDKNQSAVGVALLTLAYCFGSAIMPVAGQLMNDEHWPLPEYAIRCWVSIRETWLLEQVDGDSNLLIGPTLSNDFSSSHPLSDCQCSYMDIFFQRDPSAKLDEPARVLNLPRSFHEFQLKKQKVEDDEPGRRDVLTLFGIYESKILGDLSEKNDSFRQLHERIIVLRGAVINGVILFILCFFRAMARSNTEQFQWKVVNRVWIKTVLGAGLAAAFTWLSVRNAYKDLITPNIFDIPILEMLFGTAIIFGGYWVIRGVPYRSFLNWRSVLVTIFLTLLAYGGWIWSEVIYDGQIITGIAVLQKTAHP